MSLVEPSSPGSRKIEKRASWIGESNHSPVSPTGLLSKDWEAIQEKSKFRKLRNLDIVSSLQTDFSTGEKLIQLLEIIGDADLGKYNKTPKMRIQKIENQNKALEFIRKRNVPLTNIGAEDLVDNNFKLILGMIWSIILRFTIADITEGGLTAKEGLLLWVQKRTAPYKQDFVVQDFTVSWQNGLAFCALIHRHRPDLLNYWELNKEQSKDNMNLAFDIAEKHLGIAKLFNAEDIINTQKPDERSIMTYVAQYFHAFSVLDKVGTAGRRLGQFGQVMSQAWTMQHDYEKRATALKTAISAIINEWNQSSFADYPDARRKLSQFETYKNSTKRDFVKEKTELESLFGNIQTKLKTYNMAQYSAPQGLALQDIDRTWTELVKSEADNKKKITSFIKEIKEKLKKAFAEQANGYQKNLLAISSQLNGLNGELEAQLGQVKQLQEQLGQLKPNVEQVFNAQRLCNEANIEDNEYTIFSAEDLEFEHGVLEQSLIKRVSFVENQIVARSITNVTPEQLESYSETFKHFDKDQSNSLNREEFKAGLQAEGIHYSEQEYEKVFFKASGGKQSLSFEQFIDFMRGIEEDKTSPEQLKQAFAALAHERNFITEADLYMAALEPSVVEYYKQAIPRKADTSGFDYVSYLSTVFGNTVN